MWLGLRGWWDWWDAGAFLNWLLVYREWLVGWVRFRFFRWNELGCHFAYGRFDLVLLDRQELILNRRFVIIQSAILGLNNLRAANTWQDYFFVLSSVYDAIIFGRHSLTTCDHAALPSPSASFSRASNTLNDIIIALSSLGKCLSAEVDWTLSLRDLLGTSLLRDFDSFQLRLNTV